MTSLRMNNDPDDDFSGGDVAPMSRRTFLKSFVRGAVAAGSLLALHCAVVEPRWLEVTWHEISVPGLPPSLDGYTIAHLTDLHTHHFGLLEAQVIEALVGCQPDLVVMTGDMVESFEDLDAFTRFLTELAPLRVPMIATLGNWEHSVAGLIERLQEIYNAFDVRLMINENLRLSSGLEVAATDDSSTGFADLGAALAGISTQPGRIFLTHAPGIFYAQQVYDMPFDLVLAGHTHGGQVRLGSWRPVTSGRYVAGYYDTMLGRAYVSRGIGTTNLPVRLMCRPELPIFRLCRG